MMQKPAQSSTLLYDWDWVKWTEQTAQLLRDRRFDQVDWPHLIEEVESLGKRDRRELENWLTTLLEHALKRGYVPLPDCYRGWEVTLKRTQKEIRKILRDSPSLRAYLLEILAEVYADAIDNLQDEYDVDFPPVNPFPEEVERLLGDRFWQDCLN